jgi:V/A-type H+-transporting ATPase subunit K
VNSLFLGMTGEIWAVLGAITAFLVAGIGTSIGMGKAGQAGAGVLTEEPGRFGTVMVLQATNSTQAIYGFVVAFLILAKVGAAPIGIESGLMLFAASLPIAFVGLVSALLQGNITVACMQMIAKRADGLGRAVTLILMVEMFAIIALIVSILIIGKA